MKLVEDEKVGRRKALSIGAGVLALGLLGVGVNEGVKEIQAQETRRGQKQQLGNGLKIQPKTEEWNTVDGTEDSELKTPETTLEESTPTLVDTSSSLPENYTPNEHNLPEGVDMSQVNLDGISAGAGYGSETIDWSVMPRATFRIPEVNLSIPVVEKGSTLRWERPNSTGGVDRKYDVDVPVSFQAGHLNTSAPITAPQGTSYFFAHTNWANNVPAPFSSIKLARPGMLVQTTDDEGNLQEWVIRETGKTAQKDLDSQLGIDNLSTPKRLLAATCDRDQNGKFTINHWILAYPK